MQRKQPDAGQLDELDEEFEPMFGQWPSGIDPEVPAGGPLPEPDGVLEGAVDPVLPEEVEPELDDPVLGVVPLEAPEVEPELDAVVVGVVEDVAA